MKWDLASLKILCFIASEGEQSVRILRFYSRNKTPASRKTQAWARSNVKDNIIFMPLLVQQILDAITFDRRKHLASIRCAVHRARDIYSHGCWIYKKYKSNKEVVVTIVLVETPLERTASCVINLCSGIIPQNICTLIKYFHVLCFDERFICASSNRVYCRVLDIIDK